jgi:hypothetical protein
LKSRSIIGERFVSPLFFRVMVKLAGCPDITVWFFGVFVALMEGDQGFTFTYAESFHMTNVPAAGDQAWAMMKL